MVAVLPAAGLILAPFAGRIVDRAGPRLPAVAGALLTAAGLFVLGHLARTAPVPDVPGAPRSSAPASVSRCRRSPPPA